MARDRKLQADFFLALISATRAHFALIYPFTGAIESAGASLVTVMVEAATT